MTRGLFYIPETVDECQELLAEIIKRNPGNLDVLYAVEVSKELALKVVRETTDELNQAKG